MPQAPALAPSALLSPLSLLRQRRRGGLARTGKAEGYHALGPVLSPVPSLSPLTKRTEKTRQERGRARMVIFRFACEPGPQEKRKTMRIPSPLLSPQEEERREEKEEFQGRGGEREGEGGGRERENAKSKGPKL